MDSVYAVIREMAKQYPDIGGIGITSFGETFVMTDGQGTPLHTAMLYTDPRGAEECASIAGKLGTDRIACISGLAPHEMYSVSKIMIMEMEVGTQYSMVLKTYMILMDILYLVDIQNSNILKDIISFCFTLTHIRRQLLMMLKVLP